MLNARACETSMSAACRRQTTGPAAYVKRWEVGLSLSVCASSSAHSGGRACKSALVNSPVHSRALLPSRAVHQTVGRTCI